MVGFAYFVVNPVWELFGKLLQLFVIMSKKYLIEVKFGTKWAIIESFDRQTDALHHIKQNSGEKYPMRIVRVVKTVVFEETK